MRILKGQLFTFHYVSIKTPSSSLSSCTTSIFTFHYVSIKTITEIHDNGNGTIFTFHYVSIKTSAPAQQGLQPHDLHSTMYLLKLIILYLLLVMLFNLHSTMYLLKLPHMLSDLTY